MKADIEHSATPFQ